MSFSSKLGRVRMPGAPAAQGASAPPETAAEVAPEAPSLLDALKAKMDGLLGAAPELATPRGDALPFVREETPLGPLYRRVERRSVGALLGAAPLAPGAVASAELLALLALDPALAACDFSRALYLDTETTGLGGAGTVAFLVGLAWYEDGALVEEQVLLKQLGEEAPLLTHVAARLRDAAALVTFNGKSFDLPLLRGRYALNRIAAPALPPHLDLVHVARRVHAPKGAARRKLSLIGLEEHLLGLTRVGDLPGAEVAAAYLHWLRGGDEGPVLQAIAHNRADVAAMAALVGVYGAPWRPGEGPLDGDAFAGIARTVARVEGPERGFAIADEALAGAESAPLRRAHGELAKARRLRDVALADFEQLLADLEPARARGPEGDALRLELAKLYEHHRRDATRALALTTLGTGEAPEDAARRVARLTAKQPAQRSLFGEDRGPPRRGKP